MPSFKFVATPLSLFMFYIFFSVPSWLDPVLLRICVWLGWGIDPPLGSLLAQMVLFSWWMFLLSFVIVNVFQVSWAALSYNIKRDQNSNPNRWRGSFCPRVAVLIPVHNEEEHIRRTLESVRSQTYRNISQIIVIDDGSTDATAEIVGEYAKLDERILFFKQQVNKGKPAALNIGFSLSQAELTFFMDGDSYLGLDAIELLVPHFRDPSVGAAAGLIAIANNKSILAKCQEIEFFFTQLVTRFIQSCDKTVLICPGAGTMVRSVIPQSIFHTTRTITEDADFTFQVHEKWRIVQEPDAVSYTDAMTTLRSFNNQRIRWLYGVLQTICRHPRSVAAYWVQWAWLGYFLCPVALGFLFLVPLMFWVFGYQFLVFFLGYMLLAGAMVWVMYAAPILWHRLPSKKLVLMVPIFLVYQQYLNLIQVYCLLCKATGRGVSVKYGPKQIHAM